VGEAEVFTSAPYAELELDEIASRKQEALRLLEDRIIARGKKPEEYMVRELLPTDIGLTDDEWKFTYTAAKTATSLVSYDLKEDVFVVIYGVANRSTVPRTLWLSFWKGNKALGMIAMEDMYIEDVPKKVLVRPLVWQEEDKVLIYGYADSTGDDELIFKGYTATKIEKAVKSS